MKYLMIFTIVLCTFIACNKANANAGEIIDWLDNSENSLVTFDKQYSMLNVLASDVTESSIIGNELPLIGEEGINSLPKLSLFSALDQQMFDQVRTIPLVTLGLNWHMNNNWKAHAKLQTINESVWLPQVSVPRFITQDAENWTVAAVEVIYTF